MKYCSHCGTQLADDAAFCSNCGKAVYNGTAQTQPQAQPQVTPAAQAAQAAQQKDNNTMKTVISVLLILSCVVEGLFTLGIALAWCIPMTIRIRAKMRAGIPVGAALSVCTLLFVNTIAGILLFCLDDEMQH